MLYQLISIAGAIMILVLWFAPEIYYYSERLMATRHAFFLAEFADLPYEREMELDKVRRARPAIVFTKTNSERAVREAFPQMMELVDREYHAAGSVEDEDSYLILARNDRVPLRDYGNDRWPCYR